MPKKVCTALGLIAFGMAAVTAAPVAAQPAGEGWVAPRTPDGQPDLQGVWANNNATPLERPDAWAGKARLSTEELADLQAAAAEATDPGQDALFGDQLVLAAIARTKAESYDPSTGNYNGFWVVERDFNDRTSLVIDPPDGRIPALTPAAGRLLAERAAYRAEHPADTWDDVPLQERCVTYGVPRLGAGYNSYYQLFQTADYVVFYMEMNHDAPDHPAGRPHAAGPGAAPVARRLARPLGGRHAGGRDARFLAEEPLPRGVGQPAGGGAVHPHGSRLAGVRGHDRRPDHLDQRMDRVDPAHAQQ